MPICSRCETELIRTKSGNCKECQKIWTSHNKDRVIKTKTKFYHQNPEYNRIYKLKTRYSMDMAEFNSLLERQNFSCAICKSTTTKRKQGTWLVDHCHTTGKVRGLLCHPCNVAIGFLEDNLEILDSAKEYLSAPK